jgi:hypothetical protein
MTVISSSIDATANISLESLITRSSSTFTTTFGCFAFAAAALIGCDNSVVAGKGDPRARSSGGALEADERRRDSNSEDATPVKLPQTDTQTDTDPEDLDGPSTEPPLINGPDLSEEQAASGSGKDTQTNTDTDTGVETGTATTTETSTETSTGIDKDKTTCIIAGPSPNPKTLDPDVLAMCDKLIVIQVDCKLPGKNKHVVFRTKGGHGKDPGKMSCDELTKILLEATLSNP